MKRRIDIAKKCSAIDNVKQNAEFDVHNPIEFKRSTNTKNRAIFLTFKLNPFQNIWITPNHLQVVAMQPSQRNNKR